MTDSLFRWPLAVESALLGDEALFAAMLRFEVALAQTQAALGVIPTVAAAAIAQEASGLRIDPKLLGRAGAVAGSLAIPFVRALREHIRARDEEASEYVHFGTTSQDLLDSALVLCLKPAIAMLETALLRCRDSAIALARAQRATPMLARTLMQSAGITTLGFKAVLWAHSLSAVHERVKKAAGNALAISLGGAIGNLSAFGGKGAALRAALADALGLIDPGTTWHAQRERLTGLGCDLGIACGVMTKIARDLSLMMQAEVGEAREPSSEGRGGSTAMPHKHNPLLTMRVLAASQAVPGLVANLLAGMAQEHERALGNWQAEMDQHRMLVEHALAAAQALAELLEGLHIDPERCRANIDALHGIIFSEALTALFSPMLGKHQAQTLVAALCQKSVEEQRSLQQLVIEQLASDPALAAVGTGDVIAVFDVRNAARASEHETDRLLCALGTQSS